MSIVDTTKIFKAVWKFVDDDRAEKAVKMMEEDETCLISWGNGDEQEEGFCVGEAGTYLQRDGNEVVFTAEVSGIDDCKLWMSPADLADQEPFFPETYDINNRKNGGEAYDWRILDKPADPRIKEDEDYINDECPCDEPCDIIKTAFETIRQQEKEIENLKWEIEQYKKCMPINEPEQPAKKPQPEEPEEIYVQPHDTYSDEMLSKGAMMPDFTVAWDSHGACYTVTGCHEGFWNWCKDKGVDVMEVTAMENE